MSEIVRYRCKNCGHRFEMEVLTRAEQEQARREQDLRHQANQAVAGVQAQSARETANLNSQATSSAQATAAASEGPDRAVGMWPWALK